MNKTPSPVGKQKLRQAWKQGLIEEGTKVSLRFQEGHITLINGFPIIQFNGEGHESFTSFARAAVVANGRESESVGSSDTRAIQIGSMSYSQLGKLLQGQQWSTSPSSPKNTSKARNSPPISSVQSEPRSKYQSNMMISEENSEGVEHDLINQKVQKSTSEIQQGQVFESHGNLTEENFPGNVYYSTTLPFENENYNSLSSQYQSSPPKTKKNIFPKRRNYPNLIQEKSRQDSIGTSQDNPVNLAYENVSNDGDASDDDEEYLENNECHELNHFQKVETSMFREQYLDFPQNSRADLEKELEEIQREMKQLSIKERVVYDKLMTAFYQEGIRRGKEACIQHGNEQF
eukprot:gb/GECH01012072.1/.p1 GENE.gb/GECH01012072.1/~~gb/GECH01012072.1/.p1  ORF type:complete len:346 (+),score=90.53 gb/GECH01012072.1/:1-1038(+)